MEIVIGGAFVERDHSGFQKIVRHEAHGAHYSVWHLDAAGPESGMASLREMFPDGKANDMNFVLFSTSGVHGTYTTIEEIEASLKRYGDDLLDVEFDGEDYCYPTLTALIVQPRLVCIRCGNVRVQKADIPYLKRLRRSSLKAVSRIGLDA